MKRTAMYSPASELPVKHNIALGYIFSLVVAILMIAASLTGLLYPTVFYPTDELRQAFQPNDLINLVIGVPALLGTTWLTWRGKLIGLLCLPGALFFVLYNYLAYAFAMPPNWMFLLHLVLVLLSLYTLIGLAASLNGKEIQRRLMGAVPERAAGSILVGLGSLFLLRAIGAIIGGLVGGQPLAETELAVNISDFLITPAWIVGGVLLWRRRQPGYSSGLGLLFQASLLFLALILFLLVQPFFTGAPLATVDVIVVMVMGLSCFVPFALFARGVVSTPT